MKKQENNHFVLIAGINGAGKSTFANYFIEKLNYVLIPKDNIDDLKMNISLNNNILMQGSLATFGYIHFIDEARKNGYYVTIFYLYQPFVNLSIERIEKRKLRGEHGILKKDIEKRLKTSKLFFCTRYKHLADEWHLISNFSNPFSITASGKQDSVVVKNKNDYAFFKEVHVSINEIPSDDFYFTTKNLDLFTHKATLNFCHKQLKINRKEDNVNFSNYFYKEEHFSLVITSHAYLLNVIVDINNNNCLINIIKKGFFYGLSKGFSNNFFFVYSDNKIVVLNIVGEVIGFIKLNYNIQYVHQIIYENNGFYITSTDTNELVFYSLLDKNTISFKFKANSHINSIFTYEDKVYVLLHHKGEYNSEIFVLKHIGNKMIFEKSYKLKDKSCHNIFIEKNTLYYNASEAGDLVAVNLANFQEYIRLHIGSYNKGLSVTASHFIVGISEQTQRDKRKTSKSEIVIINRKKMKIIKKIPLILDNLSFIGNINDIKCLNKIDFSEGTSLSVQDSVIFQAIKDE